MGRLDTMRVASVPDLCFLAESAAQPNPIALQAQDEPALHRASSSMVIAAQDARRPADLWTTSLFFSKMAAGVVV
jgi:hypothetical protein